MPTTRTDQEMFDYVLQAIRKQGRPSFILNGRGGIQCKYLMPDGCRCSAGHLMDNPSDWDGSCVAPVPASELYSSGVRLEQQGLVSKLQSAHDQAARNMVHEEADFMACFEANMNEVAYKFELQYNAPST